MITRKHRRASHLAAAALAAIPLGLAIPVAASSAASAAETCVQTGFGSTGWTGNIAAVPSNGWSTGGGGNWSNNNDSAIDQVLEHAVTGFPATGATVEFRMNWRQASTSVNSTAAQLLVMYNGVQYAVIETAGPDNEFQNATATATNGATLSPEYPSRPSGIPAQTTTQFTLTLPDGVPTDGTLTYSMSWTAANGLGTAGADDFTISNVSALQCEPTVGDPLFDPWVAAGALAASGAVFLGVRRRRETF